MALYRCSSGGGMTETVILPHEIKINYTDDYSTIKRNGRVISYNLSIADSQGQIIIPKSSSTYLTIAEANIDISNIISGNYSFVGCCNGITEPFYIRVSIENGKILIKIRGLTDTDYQVPANSYLLSTGTILI